MFISLQVQVKFHLAIFDMVAKCSILNQTQFNGRFGCPNCTMMGCMASEKQTWTYPFDMAYTIRTNEMRQSALRKSQETKLPVLGWRGPSVLDHFIRVPEDVLIDYMHQVLLGVARTFVINVCAKKLDRYQEDKISSEFRNIQFPPKFNRRLRSLTSVKLWKAAEFKLLILYGFPCFFNKHNRKLFEYFCLVCLYMAVRLGNDRCGFLIDVTKTFNSVLKTDTETFGGLKESANLEHSFIAAYS